MCGRNAIIIHLVTVVLQFLWMPRNVGTHSGPILQCRTGAIVGRCDKHLQETGSGQAAREAAKDGGGGGGQERKRIKKERRTPEVVNLII